MKRVLLGMLIVGAAACGPGNELSGSIETEFDLSFDEVQIRIQNDDLIIEYLRERKDEGAKEIVTDKVAKIVIDTEGLGLGPDSVIEKDTFMERFSLERIAEPEGDFPKFKSGMLSTTDYEFKNKGSISGCFEAIFVPGTNIRGQFNQTAKTVNVE